MAKYKDLEDMLRIISLAIVRQETEEKFFRRSAQASTSEVARNLFSEIADDLAKYRGKLEHRRKKIQNALDDLKSKTEDV